MLDDSDATISAIAAFLCARGEEARLCGARMFWRDRPIIRRAEIGMFMALMDRPLCAEALSCALGEDVCVTRQILDAMVSVGVLEPCGDRYTASESTVRYCQAVAQRTLPAASEDWE